MGDPYFSGRNPYIDLKSGGSADGYINAIKRRWLWPTRKPGSFQAIGDFPTKKNWHPVQLY